MMYRKLTEHIFYVILKLQRKYKGGGLVCKLYDPLLVANNFLDLGFQEDIKITPMKLQKLLYFLYRDYLQETQEPIFAERFEAWQYGPVLNTVYYSFKKYGAKGIKDYCSSTNGRIAKINEESNLAFKRVLLSVWNKYRDYDGIELSKKTHEVGTAWYKAWTTNQSFLDDKDIFSETGV